MPVLPNGIFAKIFVSTPNLVFSNSLYFTVDTTISTPAGADAAAEHLFGKYGGLFAPLLSKACAVTHVSLTAVQGNAAVEGWSFGSAIPGTGDLTSETLPDETVMVFQKRTGLQGRQNRGRLFLSGLPELLQDDGFVQYAFRIPALALCDQLAADFEMTIDGGQVMTHCRHYNRKDNTLVPIVKVRALGMLMSRRDRRGAGVGLPITSQPS